MEINSPRCIFQSSFTNWDNHPKKALFQNKSIAQVSALDGNINAFAFYIVKYRNKWLPHVLYTCFSHREAWSQCELNIQYMRNPKKLEI